MNNATTSPELQPGEPHPALRLAEAVCALIAAIAGPSWVWRCIPGGRAMLAGLQQMSRDFSALMHRLAAMPPALPIIATPAIASPRRRSSASTGEVRPRAARLPRPAPRAHAHAPAPATAPALRTAAAPRPVARLENTAKAPSLPALIIGLRERRRRKPALAVLRNRVLIITFSKLKQK